MSNEESQVVDRLQEDDQQDLNEQAEPVKTVATWLKINDTIAMKPEWLDSNLTLKNLVYDIFKVDSLNELEAKVMQEFEDNPNYSFSFPVDPGTKTEANILIKLALEFTEMHQFNPIDTNSEKISAKDASFIESVIQRYSLEALFDLYTFADYLENEQLATILAMHIAQNEISGLSVAQLRKKFNIQADLTPEEEQQIEEQTKWINEYK